jgi:cytochrome P450
MSTMTGSTTGKTSIDALEAMLGTPDFFVDPFPAYNRLREEAPVYWCARWDSWLVTRYADVMSVLRDTETFSNRRRHTRLLRQLPPDAQTRLETWRKHFEGEGLINSDPPKHTRLRKLSNKAFTPATVEALRPRIVKLVDELLDQIEDTRGFDLVSALAYPLPAIVIAEMLGAAPEDRGKFQVWSESITNFSQAGKIDAARAEEAQQAVVAMRDYFYDLIQKRRREPKNDLVSALAAVQEDGHRFSDEELLDTCTTLLIAGHETTTSLVSNGVVELLRHPDQWRDLAANPTELAKAAVEEVLRHQSPVMSMFRRVAHDTEFQGVPMTEGDLLYVVLAAANRDPAFCPIEPDHFDIHRDPRENKHHVAFGFGTHFCLGAPLSRLEGAIAFEALARRFPRLRFAGEPRWKPNMMVRFMEHLPLAAE